MLPNTSSRIETSAASENVLWARCLMSAEAAGHGDRSLHVARTRWHRRDARLQLVVRGIRASAIGLLLELACYGAATALAGMSIMGHPLEDAAKR